jgi:hypothetical protein
MTILHIASIFIAGMAIGTWIVSPLIINGVKHPVKKPTEVPLMNIDEAVDMLKKNHPNLMVSDMRTTLARVYGEEPAQAWYNRYTQVLRDKIASDIDKATDFLMEKSGKAAFKTTVESPDCELES